MRILYFDLETSSKEPETTEVTQLAYKLVHYPNIEQGDYNGIIEEEFSEFYAVEGPVTIGSRVISGIEPPREGTLFKDSTALDKLKDLSEKVVAVAHNGKYFDFPILERYGVFMKYKADSQKLAKVLYENRKEEIEGSYKLGYLYYYFKDKYNFLHPEGFERFHEAMSDILILEIIFIHLLKEYKEITWEDTVRKALFGIVKLYTQDILETYFPFWKHKWELYGNIPEKYLQWALGIDLSDDTRKTIEYHLWVLENSDVSMVTPFAVEKKVEEPSFNPPSTPIMQNMGDINPETFVFNK